MAKKKDPVVASESTHNKRGLVPAQKAEDENDYEAESAMDTLMRARDIEQNKDLMKRVHKKVGRKLKSTKDLHDTYNEKYGRGGTETEEGKDNG